jgi:hypothetical protein
MVPSNDWATIDVKPNDATNKMVESDLSSLFCIFNYLEIMFSSKTSFTTIFLLNQ